MQKLNKSNSWEIFWPFASFHVVYCAAYDPAYSSCRRKLGLHFHRASRENKGTERDNQGVGWNMSISIKLFLTLDGNGDLLEFISHCELSRLFIMLPNNYTTRRLYPSTETCLYLLFIYLFTYLIFCIQIYSQSI